MSVFKAVYILKFTIFGITIFISNEICIVLIHVSKEHKEVDRTLGLRSEMIIFVLLFTTIQIRSIFRDSSKNKL